MLHDCVIRICEFAKEYQCERERTPRQLYNDTGYDSQFAEITQEIIEAAVSQNPSLVDDWLSFTENKCWTPAWGIAKRNDTTWIVFHVQKGGGKSYEIYFSSPVSACALMIRLEMEDFRRRAR